MGNVCLMNILCVSYSVRSQKYISCSFCVSHCTQALMYAQNNLGKALEVLFCKYYGIEDIPKNKDSEIPDAAELLERRSEEKEALESIYGHAFHEKIKHRIWTVQIKLDYLTDKKEIEQKTEKPKEKKQEKEVCRLFLHKKCRFGDKCRFLHQLSQKVSNIPILEDSYFTLEIRFPEGIVYN